MKLYLDAQSEKEIGYIPDWIRILYTDSNGIGHELTMDIQGEINYNPESLDVHVKGYLIPWRYESKNHIKDLSGLLEAKQEPYLDMFNSNIHKAKLITVGLYPVDDELEYEDDTLTGMSGEYEYVSDNKTELIEFSFEYEIE